MSLLWQEVKLDLVKLAAKARILHIHGSDRPVLSDRNLKLSGACATAFEEQLDTLSG